jgi:DNA-binding NtrC family response regulator
MRSPAEILVIDDDRATCELIAEVLGEAGYAVRCVQATDRVYAALEGRHLDLILCDLYVNGVSSLALLAALRRRGMAAGVPVVLMHTDQRVLNAVDMQGIAGCLVKPFHLSDLLDCVVAYSRAACEPTLQRHVGM